MLLKGTLKIKAMSKKSLKFFLSKERLQELAGEKVYARGVDYHAKDCVELLFYELFKAAAEVHGTHPYRVDFSISKEGNLEAECTCPAMHDWGFCKHAVATALLLLETESTENASSPKQTPDNFAKTYPNIAGWIQDGWIEIGRDGESASMIRILDRGGLVWEGGTRHKSIDGMLAEAEEELKDWM